MMSYSRRFFSIEGNTSDSIKVVRYDYSYFTNETLYSFSNKIKVPEDSISFNPFNNLHHLLENFKIFGREQENNYTIL